MHLPAIKADFNLLYDFRRLSSRQHGRTGTSEIAWSVQLGDCLSSVKEHQLIIWYCKVHALPVIYHACHVRLQSAAYGLSAPGFSARGGRFDIVYLCTGGNAGFYQARQLRERDSQCKIILVDDTQAFAVGGMRLHCTDFILRPVEFRHIVRSMNLALRGRV